VLEGKPIFADCFGNLVPLTKSGQHHVFSFYAFKENRLALFIKIRDTAQEPCGRLSFTKEPRTYRTLNHNAICNLNITLPTYSKESDSDQDADDESERSDKKLDWQDDADRKEETLAIVADLLGFSWTELARELEFSEDDIQLVRSENPNSLQEQSHALLQRWVEQEGKHATEDCLIKRLTKINRMDIVHLIETQMNKSVQEQTSRTYAEIEKTLDHSEVSVALSSVQEDADSPRVVRRVESDRRPPPAVSEEDLSVASLLDIPSWAEPVGHTHSESMHGDLLEELEIPHELNPNLWTSEDVITQEPTSYDNSDEQVSMLPTSKEAALGSQAAQVYDPKVKDQQDCCSVEVHFIRPFQSGTQCQDKDDSSQTLPLRQCDCEDEQGQSPEILKLPSSVSIRDFGLSLSESDQAEIDFSELCGEFSYTPHHTDAAKTIFRRKSDPSLVALLPADHQATLAVTEDDTKIAQKNRRSQKLTDEITAQFFKVLPGHDKIPQVSGVDMGFKPFKSSKEENMKPQGYSYGYPENMPFIDDSIEPIIPTAKYSMVKPFKMK
ncbi:ankyrin-3-like, partial [Epinephelus moara]|uniref:ankyrin-3-like n=1 Tax=Epinephelus moara TaxID=300413 RepID=UPI00214EFEC5